MTKDEVKKLRMNSPESLQFLNNATKFYNLMMMYRCAIREIQTKLEVLDDEFSVENNRNPISFIKTRIKKPNSIYDKLQKMTVWQLVEQLIWIIEVYITILKTAVLWQIVRQLWK